MKLLNNILILSLETLTKIKTFKPLPFAVALFIVLFSANAFSMSCEQAVSGDNTKDTDQNSQKAAELFRRSRHADFGESLEIESLIKQANKDTQLSFAKMSYDSRLYAHVTEALKLYLQLAEQGVAEAQFELGKVYATEFQGLGNDVESAAAHQGISQSFEKAAEQHKLAADQGYAPAIFELGLLHETGQGVPQSDAEARKLYIQAAKQGYPEAIEKLPELGKVEDPDTQFEIAVMFRDGEGVEQDLAQAAQIFEDIDSKEAQEQHQLITEQIKLAAENEDPDALFQLGKLKGGISYAQDGINEYGKAALLGNTEAQEAILNDSVANYYQGMMYLKGIGVSKDLKKARKLLKSGMNYHFVIDEIMLLADKELVAENADPDALLVFAEMYNEGKGFKKDSEKEVKFLKKAAEKGSADAQLKLARAYEDGKGVAKDLEEAIRLYKLLSDQENISAQYSLSLIYFYEKNYEAVVDTLKNFSTGDLQRFDLVDKLAESKIELARIQLKKENYQAVIDTLENFINKKKYPEVFALIEIANSKLD